MQERRRSKRYKTALEVEYDVENAIGIHSKTQTFNISENGVSIPLNKAVRPGKKINMKLKLPYNDREINAISRVAWRKPFDENLGPEENAGIEFLDMDINSKAALVDYIKNYSPA